MPVCLFNSRILILIASWSLRGKKSENFWEIHTHTHNLTYKHTHTHTIHHTHTSNTYHTHTEATWSQEDGLPRMFSVISSHSLLLLSMFVEATGTDSTGSTKTGLHGIY